MPNIYAGTSDGIAFMLNESTWAAARDSATAETISTSGGNIAYAALISGGGDQFDVARSFFAFDTSGITSIPNSATLKLYGKTGTGADIIIVKVHEAAQGDSRTDFVAHDFGKVVFARPYSSQISTWEAEAYNEITLNAAALSDMAALNEFKIAFIEHDYDYSDTAPASSVTIKSGLYFANTTGTSKDPVISYVAGKGRPHRRVRRRRKTKGAKGRGFMIKNMKQASGAMSNGFDE
jgi:hypothetical protein